MEIDSNRGRRLWLLFCLIGAVAAAYILSMIVGPLRSIAAAWVLFSIPSGIIVVHISRHATMRYMARASKREEAPAPKYETPKRKRVIIDQGIVIDTSTEHVGRQVKL